MLDARDYTLIVDCSSSMLGEDGAGRGNCWQVTQEIAIALARKCEELDPAGISLYLFSDRCQRYDNIAAHQVLQILQGKEPSGCANLAGVLQNALDDYFQRKAVGRSQSNGAIFLAIATGETSDRQAVKQTIIDASRQIDWEEELAISFIQVGKNVEVTQFLKHLDDDLLGLGAKFDIVDAMTAADLEDMTLTEVLINAIID